MPETIKSAIEKHCEKYRLLVEGDVDFPWAKLLQRSEDALRDEVKKDVKKFTVVDGQLTFADSGTADSSDALKTLRNPKEVSEAFVAYIALVAQCRPQCVPGLCGFYKWFVNSSYTEASKRDFLNYFKAENKGCLDWYKRLRTMSNVHFEKLVKSAPREEARKPNKQGQQNQQNQQNRKGRDGRDNRDNNENKGRNGKRKAQPEDFSASSKPNRPPQRNTNQRPPLEDGEIDPS